MTDYIDLFKANQELWNKRTLVHKDSDFYDVAGFMQGKEMLTPIELEELGDVKGRSLLHLQCHFGLDTLAWSRHGAIVTGIDFSQEAIAEAKRIAGSSKLDAEFICCNIYDATDFLGDRQFDIIFTSYGTIGWLPDLDKWASIIRRHLKKGGLFYIADFHPVVWMFDDDFSGIKYSYNNTEVITTESQGTYADKNADINSKEYGWNHSLSEIINSLIKNGLQIQQLNEHMYSPYPCFNNIVPAGDGQWHIKGLENKIPMVYSIKCIG